jgi:hypothetical protein
VVWPAEFLTVPRALEPQRRCSTGLGFLRSRLVAAQRRHRGLAKQRRVVLGTPLTCGRGEPGQDAGGVVECTSSGGESRCTQDIAGAYSNNMRESTMNNDTERIQEPMETSASRVDHGMALIDVAMWVVPNGPIP